MTKFGLEPPNRPCSNYFKEKYSMFNVAFGPYQRISGSAILTSVTPSKPTPSRSAGVSAPPQPR